MLLTNYTQFLDQILQKLAELKIDVSKYELDHLGYWASSDTDYDKLKSEFMTLGKFLTEKIVNGRRVGILKLDRPLQYKNYTISAMELLAPKAGQICPSALEHVEFVIPEGFDAFMKKYPKIKFDTTAINQPMFPMLKLTVDKNVQVKFHLQPVLQIVAGKY